MTSARLPSFPSNLSSSAASSVCMSTSLPPLSVCHCPLPLSRRPNVLPPRQVIAALLGLSPEEHNALQRARAEKMQRASSFF